MSDEKSQLRHALDLVAKDYAEKASYGGAGREWNERACSAVRTAADMLTDLTARLTEAQRLRDVVTRWANEFEARHGAYPEVDSAIADLRAALAKKEPK